MSNQEQISRMMDGLVMTFWTVPVHGYGNFGYCSHSMSHIEQFWGKLRQTIKKIYQIFPKSVFISYIREMEFKYFLSKKNM